MNKFNLNLGEGATNRLAFTLAEVLITLAIIGVVAALTIPSVITNYQNTQTATTLKKAYSTIANTTNLAIKDHGPISGWVDDIGAYGFQSSKIYAEKYVIPYLRISKNCANSNEPSCTHKIKFYNTSGELSSLETTNYANFYLADGTFVAIGTNNAGTGANQFLNAQVFIDVNGLKQPNTLGKDVFIYIHYLISYGKDIGGKLHPHCIHDENLKCVLSESINNCKKGGNNVSCAHLIMQNGWKIPSKEEYVRMGGDADKYPW
ncbi:MAG: prepilin-type N-terminal cleavage/methylation domain-containing protein [Cyanobacteria bacterium SIG30]|nr:prepilin-type N-terminal cleavage/methylation domain-containing protein [Cyanobacteria bacterium SIG30]